MATCNETSFLCELAKRRTRFCCTLVATLAISIAHSGAKAESAFFFKLQRTNNNSQLYVLMILLLFVIGSCFTDLVSQLAEAKGLRTMLEQFEGRKPAAGRGQGTAVAAPAGSPFLEGATVTVAGAALLQRVTAAVTKLGGNMLSSQTDLQGNQAKTGFLTIIASCDIDQIGLQQLLYNLEAGQPFLFVDQLSVQAPAGFSASREGELRVLLSVSGQWQGAKS